MDAATASIWAAIAFLALPHLLYAFIWFFPHLWMNAFKKRSVEVFETVAWLMKGLQFSSVAYWYYLRNPEGIDLFTVSPLQWILFFALAAAGQTLNLGIFRAIGHAGVYYGFKLGHTIPWHDGFPFNVVAHPQYVGSVLTVWSLAALLWNQAPQGFGLLCAYWTALYVVTGWKESSLHL